MKIIKCLYFYYYNTTININFKQFQLSTAIHFWISTTPHSCIRTLPETTLKVEDYNIYLIQEVMTDSKIKLTYCKTIKFISKHNQYTQNLKVILSINWGKHEIFQRDRTQGFSMKKSINIQWLSPILVKSVIGIKFSTYIIK